MNTGRTSTPESLSRSRFNGWISTTRVALASAIACALATGALAQGPQAPRNTQQPLNKQQRLPPGRLIVPITGVVSTTALPTSLEPLAAAETPTALDALLPEATGWFSIQRFARATDESVAAVGTLILSLSDPSSSSPRTVVTQLAMPIAIPRGSPALGGPDTLLQPIATTAAAVPGQECEMVSLILGPLDLDIRAISVQLDEVNVDFAMVAGGAGSFGALLCDVSGLIESAARPADLVRTLNTLLEQIG